MSLLDGSPRRSSGRLAEAYDTLRGDGRTCRETYEIVVFSAEVVAVSDYVQISAQISESTKRRLDQYARESGLKKNYIVEDAIEQHLDALEEIPPQYIIPERSSSRMSP